MRPAPTLGVLAFVRVEGLLVSVRIHQRKDSREDRVGGGRLEEEWIEGEGIVLQDIALVSGVVGISRYPVSRLEGRGSMFLEI